MHLLYVYLFCVDVSLYACTHMPWHKNEELKTTCMIQFPSSKKLDAGMELGSSGCMTNIFPQCTIMLALINILNLRIKV